MIAGFGSELGAWPHKGFLLMLFSRLLGAHGPPARHVATAQSSYSSWRRHHMPVSLRPSGARSSHEYMPQRPFDASPVSRVGVEHDAILEGERAHTGPLFSEGHRIGAGAPGDLDEPGALLGRPEVRGAKVVLDCARLPFLLGVRCVKVVVEVARERGRPRKAPAHPQLVVLQLCQRGPRHRRERDVVIDQVHHRS